MGVSVSFVTCEHCGQHGQLLRQCARAAWPALRSYVRFDNLVIPIGQVIFLAGEHRGQRAKLLHRNVKAGAAAVQLLADYEIVKVAFDDIAEYVGDAHEEE